MGQSQSRNREILCDELEVACEEGLTDEICDELIVIAYRTFKDPMVSEVSNVVGPVCEKILESPKNMECVPRLIKRVVEYMETEPQNQKVFVQSVSGVCVVRMLLKNLVENITERDIVGICNSRPSRYFTAQCEPPFQKFIDRVLHYLAFTPITDVNQELHAECASLLLVLLGVQIYNEAPANTFFIYRFVMDRCDGDMAPALVKALLHNFSLPNGVVQSAGMVANLAAGIATLISGMTVNIDTDHIDLLSAWLLLIFSYHCSDDPLLANPLRKPLFTFANAPLNIEAGLGAVVESVANLNTDTNISFKFDFNVLYKKFCSSLENETSTLLLYTLLHQNPHFRTFVMARTDIELLILPILKTLYAATSCASYHVWMSLVVILIFSEDDLFAKTVHTIHVKNIAWYTERPLREISLGGLMVLVLVKTIYVNIIACRDRYLHSNCLASLVNLASNFVDLHPYSCQRLVDLIGSLTKKFLAVRAGLKTMAETAAQAESAEQVNQSIKVYKVHQHDVLEEAIRTMVDVINTALRHNLRSNTNLIYAILHKKDTFEKIHAVEDFQSLTNLLFNVIRHFDDVLERVKNDGDWTEQMVMSAITEGSVRLHIPPSEGDQELKFKYIEEGKHEKFFLPYVWEIVIRNTLLQFNQNNVRIMIHE